MPRFSGWELIIILVVILLLFGAKRLPDLASSLGQSMKIFKKEIKELHDDDTPATPTQGQITNNAGAPTQPPATPADPGQVPGSGNPTPGTTPGTTPGNPGDPNSPHTNPTPRA